MLLEAEIWTVARTDKGNAVLIRPLQSDQVVPIFIGQLEAQSILIGLGNVPMPRPLTHDLFGNLLRDMSSSLLRVEIVDLREGTFYANLIIQHGKHHITIDARPSDAISLAVRAGCPVFIDEQIVLEAGVSTALIVEENPHMQDVVEGVDPLEESDAVGDSPLHEDEPTELEILQHRLELAVEEENYEEAARLRDRINALH